MIARSYNTQTSILITYDNIINDTIYGSRIGTIYSGTSISQQHTSSTIFGVFFGTILRLSAATPTFFFTNIMDIQYQVYLELMGFYYYYTSDQESCTT